MLSFVLHHHNLALYYREGDMMKKGMLLKLFVTNLYLSAFTFWRWLCNCDIDEEKIC